VDAIIEAGNKIEPTRGGMTNHTAWGFSEVSTEADGSNTTRIRLKCILNQINIRIKLTPWRPPICGPFEEIIDLLIPLLLHECAKCCCLHYPLRGRRRYFDPSTRVRHSFRQFMKAKHMLLAMSGFFPFLLNQSSQHTSICTEPRLYEVGMRTNNTPARISTSSN
jgi:hypothetical protein